MPGSIIDISLPDGKKLASYRSVPASGSGPGLVLLQVGTAYDLHPVADVFAAEGYVAMTAEIPAELAGDQLDVHRCLACLAAVLQARPVAASKAGVIGFGTGGTLAYLAASRLPIDAVAIFDAPGLERQPGIDPELRRPMVLHYGTLERTSAAAAAMAREALAGDLAVFAYPDAAPGFYLPGHASFQHVAAHLAHSRTIALLRRTLGPRYDLEALWEAHLNWEFVKVDAEGTMTTMVPEPVNLNVPVLTGGIGHDGVLNYYKTQFLGQMPKDAHLVQISRTIGADRVVDEHLLCFTHDREMDAMLPGVPPTGKYVELPVVVIVSFRGDKVAGEHIYWDQACLLVQVGKLAKKGLPVSGSECAERLRDEGLPVDALRKRWEK